MASVELVIHLKGPIHLDLKPKNIYVFNTISKLGDLRHATQANGSLDIEESSAC